MPQAIVPPQLPEQGVLDMRRALDPSALNANDRLKLQRYDLARKISQAPQGGGMIGGLLKRVTR